MQERRYYLASCPSPHEPRFARSNSIQSIYAAISPATECVLMDLEVGLHKARCRQSHTAGNRRQRQNLIPAYGSTGFFSPP